MPGFTRHYGCKRLVWYEMHEEMLVAIAREKQVKAGYRPDKGLDRSHEPGVTRLFADIAQ